MLFVALFHDDRTRHRIREEQMEAHLAYLDREKEYILTAGSLREESDEAARGGMWIIDAPDRQEAERLCHDDPFWTQGLRKWVTILHWSKAFPDQKTLV